ncbi:phosphatidylserine decarboxylase Psd3 [Schizosaccharomyces japonicus yFS275]|uniref:Phosphatidylserine decarboxylase proenzyme 2 n=1 Tax=Schizosaccharomyces japonicus (strain yFS275 / FY16936) TaxID=402676 RepID=B6K1H3_SCHJY|nr:phosphatidylserine decarboxylase Psd3 [Schizosaccharomyces japonicus yFS275]EEB07794.1 phosphatidylserine decarboxylase Psd3 [Schizosaccharomyces japonicus yFS275]
MAPFHFRSRRKKSRSKEGVTPNYECFVHVTIGQARCLLSFNEDEYDDQMQIRLCFKTKLMQCCTPYTHLTKQFNWDTALQLPVDAQYKVNLSLVSDSKLKTKSNELGSCEIDIHNLFNGSESSTPNELHYLYADASRKGNPVYAVELQWSLMESSADASLSDTSSVDRLSVPSSPQLLGTSDLMYTTNNLSSLDLNSSKADLGTLSGDERPPLNELKGEQVESLGIPSAGSSTSSKKSKSNTLDGFQFSADGELLGFMYIEVNSAKNLPPLPNALHTGFDMDPFVIVSFAHNTSRTRVIKHELNPVFHSRFLFEVGALEKNYDIVFKVVDRDKVSLNDSVGTVSYNVQNFIRRSIQPDPVTGLYDVSADTTSHTDTKSKNHDNSMEKIIADFSSAIDKNLQTELVVETLPLQLCCKNAQSYLTATLSFSGMFFPVAAIRQKFWRVMLAQYASDGQISRLEFNILLDSLGSNIPTETIDALFNKYLNDSVTEPNEDSLSEDNAVRCLEDLAKQVRLAENSDDYSSNSEISFVTSDYSLSPDATIVDDDEEAMDSRHATGLHLIRLKKCPLCQKISFAKMSQSKAIIHMTTCATHDWKRIDRIMMADYVTSSQAQKRWFSKVFNKVVYGNYRIGANSANTLVQNRKTGQIEEERMNMYIRVGIRLMYRGIRNSRIEGARVKKALRNITLKQGKKYDSPSSLKDIPAFIKFFRLPLEEVYVPEGGFKTFNEFFYRSLKPGSRPCASPDDPKVLVSPADSRAVFYESIEAATTFWIKGREFSVAGLLGPDFSKDAPNYADGSIAIFRLAPQDYHRYHSPVRGVVGKTSKIDGQYYTVNPMAVRSTLNVFGENARTITPIDSPEFGRVMFVSVGAMMVGSIVHSVKANDWVDRTDEFGYFKFGGSTVITIFEKHRVVFDEELKRNSKLGIETLVKVGEQIGRAINSGVSDEKSE